MDNSIIDDMSIKVESVQIIGHDKNNQSADIEILNTEKEEG